MTAYGYDYVTNTLILLKKVKKKAIAGKAQEYSKELKVSIVDLND